MDDERLARIEHVIAELKAVVEQRFDAVAQRFDAVDQRFDETQAQMRMLVDDVRDDIRILTEGPGGHVALEKRVTTLERRPG